MMQVECVSCSQMWRQAIASEEDLVTIEGDSSISVDAQSQLVSYVAARAICADPEALYLAEEAERIAAEEAAKAEEGEATEI